MAAAPRKPTRSVHDIGEDHDLDHDELFANATHSHEEEGESVWLVSYADMMTLIMGLFAILLAASKIDSSKFEKIKKETTLLFGGQYVVPFKDMKEEMAKVVAAEGLNEQIKFEQTDDGVAITFQGHMFFESGGTHLKESAVSLLEKLVPVIKSRAKDSNILIEGHSDDIPIATERFPSNWELSSVRACTVLRLFLDHGFPAAHLQAIGLSDTKPIVPNTDEITRAQNRRVVIRITKKSITL
jgi:chemotaxis protein MotB